METVDDIECLLTEVDRISSRIIRERSRLASDLPSPADPCGGGLPHVRSGDEATKAQGDQRVESQWWDL